MACNVRERIALAIQHVVKREVTDEHAMRAAEILEAQELSAPMIRGFYHERLSVHNMVSEALNDTLHT